MAVGQVLRVEKGTVSSRSVLHRHERGFAVFVRTDELPAARHRVGQRRGRLPAGGSRQSPSPWLLRQAPDFVCTATGARSPTASWAKPSSTASPTPSPPRGCGRRPRGRFNAGASRRARDTRRPRSQLACPRLSGPAAAAGVMGDCGYGWRYCYISDRAGGHGHGGPRASVRGATRHRRRWCATASLTLAPRPRLIRNRFGAGKAGANAFQPSGGGSRHATAADAGTERRSTPPA